MGESGGGRGQGWGRFGKNEGNGVLILGWGISQGAGKPRFNRGQAADEAQANRERGGIKPGTSCGQMGMDRCSGAGGGGGGGGWRRGVKILRVSGGRGDFWRDGRRRGGRTRGDARDLTRDDDEGGDGGGTFVKVPPHPLKTFWIWGWLVVLRLVVGGASRFLGYARNDRVERGKGRIWGYRRARAGATLGV